MSDGPWEIEHMSSGAIKVYGSGQPICQVDRRDIANARLIAAAPALLEACKAAVTELCELKDGHSPSNLTWDAIAKVNAAITAAEGGEVGK